jgi:hypothetical protein
VLVVGDVVGVEPAQRGITTGVGAAAVSGEHREALLFAEQPLFVGVGEDAARLGEQDEDGSSFRVEPALRERHWDRVAVAGGRHAGVGGEILHVHLQQQRGGHAAGVREPAGSERDLQRGQ